MNINELQRQFGIAAATQSTQTGIKQQGRKLKLDTLKHTPKP